MKNLDGAAGGGCFLGKHSVVAWTEARVCVSELEVDGIENPGVIARESAYVPLYITHNAKGWKPFRSMMTLPTGFSIWTWTSSPTPRPDDQHFLRAGLEITGCGIGARSIISGELTRGSSESTTCRAVEVERGAQGS